MISWEWSGHPISDCPQDQIQPGVFIFALDLEACLCAENLAAESAGKLPRFIAEILKNSATMTPDLGATPGELSSYVAVYFSEHGMLRAEMSEVDADKLLVERVQRGEKKAFDVLVLKYQRKVVSLISRYIHDDFEALDVAQEAFIKAYRALPNFRGDSAFYTWLYRIAINTAKNFLVLQGRRPPTDDVDAQEAEQFDVGVRLKEFDTPENLTSTNQLVQVLSKAMAALPEDLRMAIELREIDGLSYEEIAQTMDCPIGTVRSRIFRAREAIDEQIRPFLE